MKFRHQLPALLATALILLPAFAMATTIFEAVLDSDQQVPLSASSAWGTATLILNDTQTEVSYHIELFNLEGIETRAQIHNGAPGLTGPTWLNLPLGDSKDGIWTVDAFMAQELMEGRVYIDVHSDAHPHGEIRGDVGPAPSPVEDGTWSEVKALY